MEQRKTSFNPPFDITQRFKESPDGGQSTEPVSATRLAPVRKDLKTNPCGGAFPMENAPRHVLLMPVCKKLCKSMKSSLTVDGHHAYTTGALCPRFSPQHA
jgi:hypothetical protein